MEIALQKLKTTTFRDNAYSFLQLEWGEIQRRCLASLFLTQSDPLKTKILKKIENLNPEISKNDNTLLTIKYKNQIYFCDKYSINCYHRLNLKFNLSFLV